MSETTPDQARLLDEAIDLMIRLQNDPENPVSMEMVRVWRARGPDHEAAWARVFKAHGASGKVLQHQKQAERRESLGLTRRNFMIGGLLAVGAGGLGYAYGPEVLLRARADHMTAKAEIRRIALTDGSVVTLGPDSAITVNFSAVRRDVNLLAGMGFFEVAPDRTRPFSVFTGPLRATALGTAFDVSNDAGILTVSVDHGLVETQAPDSAIAAGEQLGQGQRIIFDPSRGRIDRDSREASQVASWRDNLIIAEKETVSALVARIGRWIPGRIVMADPFIGSQRVSGVFDLSNPTRALEAVVHPAGGHVRQVSSLMTVVLPF